MTRKLLVGILPIIDSKLLIVQRALHLKYLPGIWTFVAGHVDVGESMENAVKRELHEETGLEGTIQNVFGYKEWEWHERNIIHHQILFNVKVKEGNRERVQAFEGVVIAKRNRGLHSAFTVRKISYGEGVERVFQTHSPLIADITVKRRGAVRRAKLYYLRERTGKAARIKEKLN